MNSPSILCAATILLAVQVSADPLVENVSRIQGNVVGGNGLMGINIAAGDSNAQLNAKALAISVGQGAHSALQLRQNIDFSGIDQAQDSISTISGNAFSNAGGALSINQVSGVGNAQINAVSIGIGLDGAAAVSDTQLAQTTSGSAVNALENPQYRREARIEGQAFKGSSGLVQVNQLAGTGNATANNFQLSVELGMESQQ